MTVYIPTLVRKLYAIRVNKTALFPNAHQQKGSLKHGISRRKAQKIWRHLVDNLLYEQFPLNWSLLTSVELSGDLDLSIEADLMFGDFPCRICITLIYVDDALDIVQFGSSYGVMVY